jgi:hypothetical protein
LRERTLDVKMWRANAWCRTTLPVPVFLNRLDAPLCVFSLGIGFFQDSTGVTTNFHSVARLVAGDWLLVASNWLLVTGIEHDQSPASSHEGDISA